MDGRDEREIRVLHVDDDPDFADLAADLLEREGDRFDVETALSADDGLARLDGAQFDCVVSDYDMPGRDGIDFLERIRASYPDLPFILYTGKGSEEIASEAISAGVTDYLQKGGGTGQYAVLANRITNAVEKFRAQRALTERTRRLETLISNLPGMVYRCHNDPSWPMETVEGEVEALTGYSADALESGDVLWGDDILHPDDREQMWEAVQEGLADDGTFEVTYRLRTSDGTTKWAWERGRGVYAEGDKLVALEGFITDITDRKEREQRLRQTSARLEALFENSPDLINVHDTDGTIVDPNPRLCAETGYEADELAGTKVWDLDQSLDPDSAYELWEDMDVGDSRRFESVYQRRDGSTFPVEVHIRRLRIEGEDRFVAIGRDITDRKERDRELQRHEAYLEESSDIITVLDDEGTVKYQSPAVERTLGYGQDELVGRNGFEYVHPDDVDEVRDAFTDLVAEPGATATVECRFRTADDDWCWLEVRGTNRLEHDAVDGIVTNNRDVTQRMERQRELERTNTVLSTLVETLPVGVIAEDADRTVIAGNDRVADLFGLSTSRDEIVGADCEQLAEAVSDMFDEPEQFVERIDERVTERESVRDETLSLRDGRTFARSYEPIELPAGDGHLWVYRDVTTRNRREQELERQNERFDELASAVSHDLQTPLETARGRAQLAVETGDVGHVEQALDALERADELREDIVQVLREKEVVGDTEPVDVGRVSRDIWETIRTPDGTSLQVHGAPSVEADPGALRRLLENLFSNAIEHGGDAVTVRVGETDGGFYVEDDGPGIPDGEREEVFTPGYSTKRGGSGVGLASVRHIVAAHDWEVLTAEGSAGGARFEITVDPATDAGSEY